MLYGEVHLASRKRIGEKKIDVSAPRGTLGVRYPTPKLLCGALTSILVFFPVDFFFTRATDFAENEGLLEVEHDLHLIIFLL